MNGDAPPLPLSRKERLRLYPSDWKDISRRLVAEANYRCQNCGVRDGEEVRSRAGKRYKVRLNGCHLDQDPRNNDPNNLRAMCQACHLRFDARFNHHKASQTETHKAYIEAKRLKEAQEIYHYIAEMQEAQPEKDDTPPAIPPPSRVSNHRSSLKDRITRTTLNTDNDL